MDEQRAQVTWEQRLPRFLHPPALLDTPGSSADRVVTPRLALFFLAAAAVLVPWTTWLFLTLPAREQAERWNVAWGGFDALLVLVFAAAAVRILRLSVRSAAVNAVAAALLVVDAWFDVMLAPAAELPVALLMAVLVELPMAFLCARTSLRVLSLMEQARPYLVAAGFTVRQGRLVPPEGWVPEGRVPQDRVPEGRVPGRSADGPDGERL
ncbi:hypothetical protein ACFVH7_10545 [Kitasatospora indigofera]|uniref:hypothetical protein n=1 Tax=Kitasatospora indigofera TaxID=67307 RepID=UPI003644B693